MCIIYELSLIILFKFLKNNINLINTLSNLQTFYFILFKFNANIRDSNSSLSHLIHFLLFWSLKNNCKKMWGHEMQPYQRQCWNLWIFVPSSGKPWLSIKHYKNCNRFWGQLFMPIREEFKFLLAGNLCNILDPFVNL